MRRVLCPLTFRGGVQIDENTPIFDFHWIRRDAISFEPGFTDPGAAMEFPIVPWTDDILPVQPAFAKWAPDMIASVGNHADSCIFERNRKFHVGRLDAAERRLSCLLQRANIEPVLASGHRVFTLLAD
jgi:hypothetical protein